MAQTRNRVAHIAVEFLVVPWNAFMAAFVFYVGVTIVAISGVQLPDVPMVAAYVFPVVIYAAVLLSRALHGAASLIPHHAHAAVPALPL